MIDHISKFLDKNRSLKISQTIADLIYENLKESILRRKLSPNQRIKIREIASFLGVSQTPVREAIQRLAAEKFLIVTARSDVRVIDLKIQESQSLSELIQILDLGGMKKVYLKIPDTFIQELRKMTEVLGDHYSSRKIKLYIDQNILIHKRIWQLFENEAVTQTLIQALERLHLVERQYLSYFTDKNYLAKSWREHVELVEALAGRDWARLENLITSHWHYS